MYHFREILKIAKEKRFPLFEFCMTEVVPVCFQNISQLIVATSFKHPSYKFKKAFEPDNKSQNKSGEELVMLSDIIIENISDFVSGLKNHHEIINVDDDNEDAISVIPTFTEFAGFLLQNSFSSDHQCRHQSQKVLCELGQKFFVELTEIDIEGLPDWIMELLTK